MCCACAHIDVWSGEGVREVKQWPLIIHSRIISLVDHTHTSNYASTSNLISKEQEW